MTARQSGEDAVPEVTHGRVLRIAVPMTLAFLSTPLVGLVDTIIIGRLGEVSLLGGIAVGAILFDVIFVVFNFLRMGTTGLTAQASGRDDRTEINAILFRTLAFAIAAAAVLIVVHKPALVFGLEVMEASPGVSAAASTYFTIRILAAPFELANYAILGWFLGLGRAGIGLALQTLLNGVNIGFSVWFVVGLDWGVEGVAWGTFIGQAVATVAGLALVTAIHGRSILVPWAVIFSADGFGRLLSINRDIMVRSAALIFAFGFFTVQGSRQSELILAANAVLMNFLMIAGYFLDGFATAAEQLVGTAIGRRSRAMVQRAVRLTVGWGIGLGGAASLVFLGLGPVFIDMITTSPEVRAAARQYLVWAALTPLAGVLAFEFDGVFIGATWGREMRNMMLVALAIGGVVWWLALPVLGNHGLWLALHAFLLARGLTLMARYPACLARAFPAG
ncbi:DNA-damage-inducible protein F [hydrothermal vent metagenome]|uniref:DNA-damage-inducible protein F n=1 Tax=hydrothermal vent metagenome TaxID=652676 RepID=A0A3B0T346_9ZZZZ